MPSRNRTFASRSASVSTAQIQLSDRPSRRRDPTGNARAADLAAPPSAITTRPDKVKETLVRACLIAYKLRVLFLTYATSSIMPAMTEDPLPGTWFGCKLSRVFLP